MHSPPPADNSPASDTAEADPAKPGRPGWPGWFDAHLDLAYLAEIGRDLHAPLAEARGRLLPAAVTLPALRDGGVRGCLGTVFTAAIDPSDPEAETGSFAYPSGDAAAARKAGLRQLKLYEAWRSAGLIEPLASRHLRASAAAPAAPPHSAASASGSPAPGSVASGSAAARLRLGVLVEGADPIESPDDLPEWVAGGVVAIGLSWFHPGRYACGNGTPPEDDTGLSSLGRALVRAMDELGVVHDASHLADRSLAELFESAEGPIVATHSNCRALLGTPAEPGLRQRHLTDEAIGEIVRRGGVIGLNLYTPFLRPGDGERPRATIAEACAHVEHICAIAGGRRHVGLGSDMDGGFAADTLPAGIDRPTDLVRLAEGLAERGWSHADIAGFAWGNWARFWGLGG